MTDRLSFIVYENDLKAKAVIKSMDYVVSVTFRFWNPKERTVVDYPVKTIEFQEDGRIKMGDKIITFHVDDKEDYTLFKNTILELRHDKDDYDRGTKMCVQFLREFCGVTPEDEEKFKIWENIRLYTSEDKPFMQGKLKYDPPVGWYRLKLEMHDEEKADHWVYGYHGTKAKFVGSIIRNRLVVPGNKTTEGDLIQIQSGHIPGMNHIYTSPSLHYSAHYIYAEPTEFRFTDESGNETLYHVRTVFQIRQQPETYKIQGNTIHSSCWDPHVRMDDTFTNDELEWFTVKPETIIPIGLLLNFSEVPIKEVYEKREEEQCLKYAEHSQGTFEDSRIFVQESFVTKKKVLWVDDVPSNNDTLMSMFTERGVKVELCLDTDSAIAKVKEDGPNAYSFVITDMCRMEKREGDDEPKRYLNAGLDFLNTAKEHGWTFPIYVYSSYVRTSPDLMHSCKEAGAEKICTYQDMVFMIKKDDDEKPEEKDDDGKREEKEEEKEVKKEDVSGHHHTFWTYGFDDDDDDEDEVLRVEV